MISFPKRTILEEAISLSGRLFEKRSKSEQQTRRKLVRKWKWPYVDSVSLTKEIIMGNP